ncbi:TPA: GNAT family N-acetyltransferase [Candidatus Peregrinibacteria bacterium]|nr:GNAT family N-acetyltransferase [Candidatus Peregrinibacteria bacterium]HIQ57167.1 GNAT family N-acetyltransferase [Candidatus Gracilibacteria bacterium]
MVLLLDDLIVDEKMRGENIASQLLERVEIYAQENSISTLKLDSGMQRIKAHSFYEKHDNAFQSLLK